MTMLGAQFVMTCGAQLMLVLLVFNWDTNVQVNELDTTYYIICVMCGTCFDIGAAAFSQAFFGQGTGRILLDNLGCVGTETRLVDCPHNGIGIENCVHAEDAGLRCAGK